MRMFSKLILLLLFPTFCLANENITFSVPFAPIPFPTYDEKNAVVYELLIHNNTNETIHPIAIDVNENRVNTLIEYKKFSLNNNFEGDAEKNIPPGQSAILFLWMLFPANHRVPENFSYQMIYNVNGNPQDVRLSPLSDPMAIQEKEVLSLDAPLETGPWLAEGTCNDSTSRRLAIFDNQLGMTIYPERFAISWTKYDRVGGSDHQGDGNQNSDYYAYGQKVLAASEGKVVAVRNSLPDNLHPGQKPQIDNLLDQLGNYVIIATARKYIIYAHLQTNILVSNGQVVNRGQVIGYVGSSGDVSIPQLQIIVVHANNSSNPLIAQGLPYTFKNFTLLGFANNKSAYYLNAYLPISMDPKIIQGQLPLAGMFVYWS